MRVVANSSGIRLLHRLGTKLGLADPLPPPPDGAETPLCHSSYPFEALQSAIAAADIGLSAPTAISTPASGASTEAFARLMHAMDNPAAEAPLVREICDDLRGVLGIFESTDAGASQPAEATAIYPVLRRKNVAVLGMGPGEQARAVEVLERQGCVCRTLAAGGPGDWSAEILDSDLIVVSAPRSWELTQPLTAEPLDAVEKPVLVTGPRSLLARLAQVAQSGPRDYLAAGWNEEEIVWRAALLLSSPRRAGTRKAAKRQQAEVLIADEDATARTLLASMLTKHGMICHAAADGAEALDLMRRHKPCAAIVDVIMPALDGFQLIAATKQDPALTSIPVMFLTSRNGEVDKLQAFALGADDYITKPFSPMEVAIRLKRLLKRL